MRTFLVIVVLLAIGIGIGGFALGWFNFSTSSTDDKKGFTVTVDPDKVKHDRDAVLALFHSSRDTFQNQTETQLKGMDRNLAELKEKAKTASAETRDQLTQKINDLGKKTQSARQELRELGSATQEDYDAVKARVTAAMVELKDGFDKAGSRLQ